MRYFEKMRPIARLFFVIGSIATPVFADVRLEHVDVFTDNTEGYRQFRIPSISRTADGTLHAFAEGRLTSTADPGGTHIDLVYKRSTDGGRTWTPLSILDRHPDTILNGSGVPIDFTSASNSVAVVDQSTNRLYVFNMRLPHGQPADSSSPIVDDTQVWMRYTDDNGQTWSTASRLNLPEHTDWRPNLGSGIQMNNGTLIVPATARQFDGTTTKSFALRSTDHGATWQAGAIISTPTNEQQVVELADGTLFSSSRQNAGSNRVFRTSNDGGATWQSTSTNLPMTAVAAGLERYSLNGVDGATENRILFSLPEGGVYGARSRLAVRSSLDEALTFPTTSSRLLYHGPAAYSDLQRLPGDEVGVLWERGPGTNQPNDGNKSITYTVFNDEFLKPNTATGVLANESFDYSGPKVGWANGGNGWNSAWSAAASGTGALNSEADATLTATGLTHSGVNYEKGGAAVFDVGQTVARGLGVGMDLGANSTYYFSSLLQRQTAPGSFNRFLDIKLLDSAGVAQAGIGAGSAGNWGIYDLGNTQTTAPGLIQTGTTYLVIGKIVATDVGADQIFLKVIADGQVVPTSDAGLAWTLVGTTNEMSFAQIDRIAITGGINSDWLVDELRVGTDWHSVTHVPEPASIGMTALGLFVMGRRSRRLEIQR